MTQDNIVFNSVKIYGKEIDSGPLGILGKEGGVDEFGGVINAVDIDWNGAELELPDALGGTQYISTTGQLFRRL